MTGNLLDTNVAILAPDRPEILSLAVQQAILNGPNFISAISYWEVVIKSMKGKLNVGDARSWWRDTLIELAATPLPLLPFHVDPLHTLPSLHKDPFDRILIAQAAAEHLTLVTTDKQIARYASSNLQVLC